VPRSRLAAPLAAWLQALWYRSAVPPWPLRLLSRPFGLVVRLRRAGYARGVLYSRRLPKPVIVVGNISVGGSGKTPLVIWLAQQLAERGLRPGVVLRGYGGSAARGRTPRLVQPGCDVQVVGDEALLLRERTGLPVAVGRDRGAAAQLLLAAGVDVIIADDGLQHLRLARDFEIAVIDGARGVGNGFLLPAGPLREPALRLASVDAIVVNGAVTGAVNVLQGAAAAAAGAAAGPARTFFMRLTGEWLRTLGGGESVALSSLAGQRVHAIAGIGHPQRFFAQLASAGLTVVAHAFPDHHRYRAAELDFGDQLPLLMTEKDAVKCRAFAAANRWYLPVAANFEGADGSALLALLRRCLAS
jgi:tetraacyldisaccharide 4'-kinase